MNFKDLFPKEINKQTIDHFSTEALAHLDYELELDLKNKAAKRLVSTVVPEKLIADIVPSPLPRKYRTTTKRRLFFDGRQIYLHFGKKHGRENTAVSILEPDIHQDIYLFLQKFFSMPRNFKASAALNYIIIRGSYSEHAVIFNVKVLNGDVVRILKIAVRELTAAVKAVKSVFVYVDETNSDYYLESERPEKGVSFKKLYGSDFLALQIGNKKFLYSPTSFSQINESILPVFFETFKEYLTPAKNDILMDLYCGYGLWSLLAGDNVDSVWGVELSQQSIKSANANAKFHYPAKCFYYECFFADAATLKSKMPPPRRANEWILLDPPRKGCMPGVQEYIISRKPQKIFHLFCGADEIVPALNIYKNNNCKIEKLIPFDFFPGTMNIEVLAIISTGQNQ